MLHEKQQPDSSSKDSSSERVFVATRLNIFGNHTTSEFKVSECTRVTAAQHPFASFVANKAYYYIGRDIRDEQLKDFLK